MPRREKKYHYIYKTTNLLNEKFYVGMHSTDDLNDGYLGSGKRLRYSINKYGRENFKIEFLEFFDIREKLVEREKNLVNEDLIKNPLCMNIMCGGVGGFISVENQRKRSIAAGNATSRKIKNDLKYRKKFLKRVSEQMKYRHKLGIVKYDTFKNKNHTAESKIKIGKTNSEKQKGSLNSQFGTCWINNKKENKKIKKTELNKWIEIGWIKGRI